MRVWLSYSTLCHSLEAALTDSKVILPEPGDCFFFGCHEVVVGSCPYAGHSNHKWPTGVLMAAQLLYSTAKAAGRAVCSGDLRDEGKDLWEELANLTGDRNRFMTELGIWCDQNRSRGDSYCYPTAVEVLERVGIVGVNHVERVDG